jgi:hypothetical protein
MEERGAGVVGFKKQNFEFRHLSVGRVGETSALRCRAFLTESATDILYIFVASHVGFEASSYRPLRP